MSAFFFSLAFSSNLQVELKFHNICVKWSAHDREIIIYRTFLFIIFVGFSVLFVAFREHTRTQNMNIYSSMSCCCKFDLDLFFSIHVQFMCAGILQRRITFIRNDSHSIPFSRSHRIHSEQSTVPKQTVFVCAIIGIWSKYFCFHNCCHYAVAIIVIIIIIITTYRCPVSASKHKQYLQLAHIGKWGYEWRMNGGRRKIIPKCLRARVCSHIWAYICIIFVCKFAIYAYVKSLCTVSNSIYTML